MNEPRRNHDPEIESLERQMTELSKHIERAVLRIEEVVRQFHETKMKSATQEVEILHVKMAIEKAEKRITTLEEDTATREHIKNEVAPIALSVLKLESSQTWLIRLIIGSVVLAVLSLLGIGISK